jgi:hypothetical protein
MAKENKSYYNLLDDLTDKIDLDNSSSIAEFAPGVPKDIRTFLGRLSMLQDVPYHYLVPDARLVHVRQENGKEIGALRFFWIDPLWVQSLLSGALSVGEDYNASFLLKEAMAGNYIAEVFHEDSVKRLKDQLSGAYSPVALEQEILDRLNVDREKRYKVKEIGKAAPATTSQTNWRYTGFLLRSSIVSSLKGLEVTAKGLDNYDDKSLRKLSVLRVEYIADDTLFCLCEGIITQVVITQPAENLHFGFNVDNDGHYKMVNEDKKVKIQHRNNKRTLKFNGNDGIIAALSTATGTAVGPGDVAVHLLSKPIRHTVTIDWKEEKSTTDEQTEHQ